MTDGNPRPHHGRPDDDLLPGRPGPHHGRSDDDLLPGRPGPALPPEGERARAPISDVPPAPLGFRCAQCRGDLGLSITNLASCPHCGTRKAAACATCAEPIFLGATTCSRHSAASVESARGNLPGTSSAPVWRPSTDTLVAEPDDRPRIAGRRVPRPSTLVKVLVAVAAVQLLLSGDLADVAFPDRTANEQSSPARAVLTGPCASFRTLPRREASRLPADGDDLAVWADTEAGAFDEAARLDAKLEPASDAVRHITALDGRVGSGRKATLPLERIADVCFDGVGAP